MTSILLWPHLEARADEILKKEQAPAPNAIRGFDAVSYFADGDAVKGRYQISITYDNKSWFFATEDHKRMFEAEPARYLPQYGGLCAAEMAAGRKQPANPANWVIIDGKLYMVSGGTQDLEARQRNAYANIKAADEHWAKLSAQ